MTSFDHAAVLFERLRKSPAWRRLSRDERSPLYYGWIAHAWNRKPASKPGEGKPTEPPTVAPAPAPAVLDVPAPMTQGTLFGE